MGTKGREMVDLDLYELLKGMNKALADEWLAYYQYWVGSKIAKGRMRGIVAKELEEHANEELKHANMLTERILQLGGIPLTHPKMWEKESNCGYDEPSDSNTFKLLEQNIKGEQCAIKVYESLLGVVEGKDPITYQLILDILRDEVEHEDDLEALLEDTKTKIE